MEASEIGFVDAEGTYSTDKDPISFKLIVLIHLKKITQLCCCEWHGGYWKNSTKVSGGMSWQERTYKEDTRECFWNAINCLYDLCSPYFDKQMIEEDKNIQQQIDLLEEKQPKEKDDKKIILNKKMSVMRKLFRCLSSFLKRQDYFKGKTFED